MYLCAFFFKNTNIMITFWISLAVLVLGYVVYGAFTEKVFGIDTNRETPATRLSDGVDYVPMKPWKLFLIQFLNIAGVGPICGAIMGAQFGTASYLWIVLGCIFGGAVHDYMSGMISLREDGASLPEIHGKYLGNGVKQFMRGFMVFLMILVGVVFVNTPAQLLQSQFAPNMSVYVWVVVILIYYMLATLLPIDKVIGKIYPIFGFLLIGMAVAIVAAFVIYRPAIPEIWEGMQNLNPKAADNPIFPMMLISIACGAVSGFHATQSTLVARCMVNESQGRRIFYGAMIVEGIVALIWAAAASYFYHDNPALLSESGPAMVGIIANRWFPKAIAVVTILGVISAAITSGDTALRSCRLIMADFMNIEQKSLSKRLWVAVPIFAVTAVFLVLSLAAPKGFAVVWQYFSWANQFLSAITLWAVTVYIARNKTGMYYLISLIPALFMTMATTSFLLVSKTSLGSFMPRTAGYVIAAVFTAVTLAIFLRKEIVKKA